MDFKILLLETLASLKVAMLFWNNPFKFKNLELRKLIKVKNARNKKWETLLTECREKSISNLNAFYKNPELPLMFKPILTENIFLLHQAYRQLFLWKKVYDPCNNIDLLQEGNLYAVNFFTVEGEFDDFSWIKFFILDKSYSIKDRFRLSCYYSLENGDLWSEFKLMHGNDINNLNEVYSCDENLEFISHKVFHLNNYDPSYPCHACLERFWKIGFELATEGGYEHSMYYFWKKMSFEQKSDLFESGRLFELMNTGIDYPRDKITYFLFCQMSKEIISDLFEYTLDNSSDIWLTLLISPCSRSLRSQIINDIFVDLSPELYVLLFVSLARRIELLKLPYDVKMFSVLWRKLTREMKRKTLEGCPYILNILATAKSLPNLCCIIGSMPRKRREKCLLENRYGACYVIIALSVREDFDMVQKYVSLFLTEKDSYSNEMILRNDASQLLGKFLDTENVIWHEIMMKFEYIVEIHDRMETLDDCLTLVQELCQTVDNEVKVPSRRRRKRAFEEI